MDLNRSEDRVVVVADTSFLMLPGLFGVDVEEELGRLLEQRYEMTIPMPVLQELEQLATHGSPKERMSANIGLLLTKRAKVIEIGGQADDAIMRIAGEKRCVVGTTDAKLRKELRRRRVPVIYLRQRSHLAIDGQII